VCLGERARSLARFGVEKKPGNGLVDRRRHARLHRGYHLATVEIFPGRSCIMLADELVLWIEQLCVRSPEHPAGGARRIADARIDLDAGRRHHAKNRQLVWIERGGYLNHASLSASAVHGGQSSDRERRGEKGQMEDSREYGHRSLLFLARRRSEENRRAGAADMSGIG